MWSFLNFFTNRESFGGGSFLPPTQFIRVANSYPEGKESGVVKGKCIVSGAWAESVIALINLRVQTCITLRFLCVIAHNILGFLSFCCVFVVVDGQCRRKLNSCPNNNSISPCCGPSILYSSVRGGVIHEPLLAPIQYPYLCVYTVNMSVV